MKTGIRRLLRLFIVLTALATSLHSRAQIDSALMKAIKTCDLVSVQKWEKSTADINAVDSNGANALMWAVFHCDLPIVRALVYKGALAPDSGVIYGKRDQYGNMLSVAARGGKLKVFTYLVDRLKLPLNAMEYNPRTRKNDGRLVLSCALRFWQKDIVLYLLKRGVNVNTIDEQGNGTALINAAELRQWDMFDLLLKAGAKEGLGNRARYFINAATAAINTTAFSGSAATEQGFKALDGKSPKLLHLATHGFFLPVAKSNPSNVDLNKGGNAFTVQQNPMFRSGLVLAGGNQTWKGGETIKGTEDGILTAYEIAQLDLSNTDLVVLSACETALGDLQGNEGVIGLQRAFKLAGVKQMIISLWKVPDEATVELMTVFYSNWLDGQTTREALRRAQLKMKEKYPPYFWAAFILVE
ncbi:MAG: CHAT domain-containing protein [Chitinophagaceae bacterium]